MDIPSLSDPLDERNRVLSEFPGDLEFLHYLWDVERRLWLKSNEASFRKSSHAEYRRARRYADQLDDGYWDISQFWDARRRCGATARNEKCHAADKKKWDFVCRVVPGSYTICPERWFWVSALMPHLVMTCGEPRWAWLTEWGKLLGWFGRKGGDEDNLRQEWQKNVAALKTAAVRLAKSRGGYERQRALTRVVDLSQMFNGAWSYIRWLRTLTHKTTGRISNPSKPLPLVGSWIASGQERKYCRIMVDRTPCFRLAKLSNGALQVLYWPGKHAIRVLPMEHDILTPVPFAKTR